MLRGSNPEKPSPDTSKPKNINQNQGKVESSTIVKKKEEEKPRPVKILLFRGRFT